MINRALKTDYQVQSILMKDKVEGGWYQAYYYNIIKAFIDYDMQEISDAQIE